MSTVGLLSTKYWSSGSSSPGASVRSESGREEGPATRCAERGGRDARVGYGEFGGRDMVEVKGGLGGWELVEG
eukprot:894275-Prorocentrum_minimum.AAC.3